MSILASPLLARLASILPALHSGLLVLSLRKIIREPKIMKLESFADLARQDTNMSFHCRKRLSLADNLSKGLQSKVLSAGPRVNYCTKYSTSP